MYTGMDITHLKLNVWGTRLKPISRHSTARTQQADQVEQHTQPRLIPLPTQHHRTETPILGTTPMSTESLAEQQVTIPNRSDNLVSPTSYKTGEPQIPSSLNTTARTLSKLIRARHHLETISFYLSDNDLPPGYLHKARTLTAAFTPEGASDTTLAALCMASSLWIKISHEILQRHYREEVSKRYAALCITPSCPDWQEAWYLGIIWPQKLLSEPLLDRLLQDIRDSLPNFYGNWLTRDNGQFKPPLTHCQPYSEDEDDAATLAMHTRRTSPSPRTNRRLTSERYPRRRLIPSSVNPLFGNHHPTPLQGKIFPQPNTKNQGYFLQKAAYLHHTQGPRDPAIP